MEFSNVLRPFVHKVRLLRCFGGQHKFEIFIHVKVIITMPIYKKLPFAFKVGVKPLHILVAVVQPPFTATFTA